MDTAAVFSIRAKKLGAILHNARSTSGKTAEDCAAAMGVSLEMYEKFERGDQSPSLPQLELLAYFMRFPLDYFWDDQSLVTEEQKLEQLKLIALTNLRNRVIGALLRKRRVERGLSVDELAQKVGISPEQLFSFETGRTAVPVPLLEQLSEALAWTVSAFQDDHGPVGSFFVQERSTRNFKDLAPELQQFVVQPVNRPYLELAMRLSEMDVNKLRNVAEGLLEITL